jgi:elongation factor Ts
MNDMMKLKDKTGAGLKDCKEALEASKGDFDKAIAYLREKGKATAAKKADRIAAEGAVGVYSHHGKIGVMVEVNCETDFAAKSEKFQQLVKDIAMQIAASNPLYLDESQVPTAELEKEREILRNKAKAEKKPEAVIEKMLEGQVKKYYADICLLYQPFVKEPSKTVKDIVIETAAGIGEKISVRRFVRYELGAGIEKKNENFADEVAKVSGKM